ncbi:Sm-like ribonucleoprotein, partial [Ramicandelaber brevisporus]
MVLGVPILLLHESLGHIITLELANGATYRGKLIEVEDNMNVQLTDITSTARDGRSTRLDQVFIRGSQIRFFVVPDMLRNAPVFTQLAAASKGGLKKTRGVGVVKGKSSIQRGKDGQQQQHHQQQRRGGAGGGRSRGGGQSSQSGY